MQPIVLRVNHAVIPERHIADDHIEKAVGQVGFLKAGDLDVGFLVQLAGDSAGQAVQLHTKQSGGRLIQIAVALPKKRAHTHTGFQNRTGTHAHFAQGGVHCVNDFGRGVKGGQGAAAGSSVFFLCQQAFQLGIFAVPAVFVGFKGIGQAAPAGVLGKNFLLLAVCVRTTVCHTLFDGFQSANCGDVGGKLFARCARGCRVLRRNIVVR